MRRDESSGCLVKTLSRLVSCLVQICLFRLVSNLVLYFFRAFEVDVDIERYQSSGASREGVRASSSRENTLFFFYRIISTIYLGEASIYLRTNLIYEEMFILGDTGLIFYDKI